MRYALRRSVLVVAVSILASRSAPAAVWTSIGPDGGPVQSVTIDPGTPGMVWATSGPDTYRSVDGGLTWTRIDDGFFGGFRPEVVIDPLSPSNVYVAASNRMLKSTDGGATWEAHLTGDYYASSVAIDPDTPSTLWIGDLGKVLRSTDGGVTWNATPLPNGASAQVFDLLVDPVTPATLYAAASFGTDPGIYKSVDGGLSFAKLFAALAIQALDIDPVSPSRIYAANASPPYVYRSTDAGATWSPSATGIVSGVARHGLAVDPSNPLVVYAGSSNGVVHKSTDGGGTWTPLSSGLPVPGYVQSVVVDPGNSSTVLGGERSGVARSADAGLTWTVYQNGLRVSTIRDVTVDPTDAAVLYATSYDLGVMKSTDGGASWASANTGIGTTYVERVLVDPSTPSTLYLLPAFGGDPYKSTDGGASWTFSSSGLYSFTNGLALAPSAPLRLYAATFNGVFVSVDGAASWNPTTLASECKSIAVDPTNADIAYAGSGSTVYKTVDGGATWTSSQIVPAFLGSTVTTLAVDPGNPSRVYASLTGGFIVGTARSGDGGVSWSFSNTSSSTDFAFLPGRVFAAASSAVFGSADEGASWVNLQADLRTSTNGIAVAGTSLYAGTYSEAIWRRSVGTCTADADCSDGNVCTTDTCDPVSPSADFLGCVHGTVTCPTPPVCQTATCQPSVGCVNHVAPDNTPCPDDGSICTTDVCRSGACAHEANVYLTCRNPVAAGKSTLAFQNLDPARPKLTWKWRKGEATSPAEFGNPVAAGASDYTVCGFDRSGPAGSYAPFLTVRAPAGGTCHGKPCWGISGLTFKYKYKDRDRTPDGGDTLSLTPGGPGEAKIAAVARGPNLTLPSAALVPDVRVQVRRDDDSTCWEARYSGTIVTNTPGMFKATSDP
jgi:photosystem II stability/assembly factor-like uncharacterized protein